ncbi:MAG: CPXCG motif-containing cysteine-rich protein [Gammaproteobacteria bacterium]|nr:CPXCG motif-containing cysteine-rich protein [Gammaproteobacteria bacterium]
MHSIGLAPVFEPGGVESSTSELGLFVELQCPWCGERYGSMLDLTDASRSYIEDCQVCCRPIEVRLQVSERGELERVSTSRVD